MRRELKRINRILLINPPMNISGGEPKFVSFGIAYIAQKLRNEGYEIEILDIDAYRYSKQEVSDSILKKDFDIIGIGGLVTVYGYLFWLIPEIKKLKPHIEIILGGGIASSLKQRCFNRFDIDYEVIGEGEETIVELLKELQGDMNLHLVKGIGYRKDGKVEFTAPRPLKESLDDVPMFDDTLFPMAKLIKNSEGIFQVHTQRGCPFACTFCFNCYRVVSRKVRYRPVKNVLDEIEYYKRKYDIELFALCGELIMLDKNWIINFCESILKRNLKIRFRVTSRVDTLDKERLVLLRRSGCVSMSIGLESGSDKILKIMKKMTTVGDGRKAVSIAKKYIQNLELSWMLNYIGETKETVRESVDFFKDLSVKPTIFFATAYPGTELYEKAIEMGRIKDEEAYMMDMDNTSILKPYINLTDMPDEEAFKVMNTAVREVNKYYFRKSFFTLKSYTNIFQDMRRVGVKKIIKKIGGKVKKEIIGELNSG